MGQVENRKTYVTNAFTLSMLPLPAGGDERRFRLSIKEVTAEETRRLLERGFISAIGHQGTAELLSELLGMNIPVNRIAIRLDHGDRAIVIQLLERLPEGKILSREEIIQLYQQGKVKLYLVEIEYE